MNDIVIARKDRFESIVEKLFSVGARHRQRRQVQGVADSKQPHDTIERAAEPRTAIRFVAQPVLVVPANRVV